MTDVCISLTEAIKALKGLEQEDIETYGCRIPEGFDADRAIEKLKNLPKAEQEPKFIIKSDGTIEQIKNCEDCVFKKEWEQIKEMLSIYKSWKADQEGDKNGAIYRLDSVLKESEE